MNVILITAEELAAGRVVLPPKVVREYGEDSFGSNWTERTVSQTLPERSCPRCDSHEGDAVVCDCDLCEGRGSLVVIHLAIEQCRNGTCDSPDGAPWSDWEPSCGWPDDLDELDSWHERRQAIVGYVTPTVLPVVGLADDDHRLNDCIIARNYGVPYRHQSTTVGSKAVPLHEPWAQGLVPGSVVLEWDTVTPIDPPIVEMACFHTTSDGEAMPCFGGRVPLALSPGLNVVELAP